MRRTDWSRIVHFQPANVLPLVIHRAIGGDIEPLRVVAVQPAGPATAPPAVHQLRGGGLVIVQRSSGGPW